MKKRGLKPRYPKRFKVTTDSGHNEAVSPDLLNRQFDVAAPNKGWKTDITYVWALEGAGPLLATCGLHWVLMPCKWHFGGGNLNPAQIHHSDRGSQYASHEYRSHLRIMKMEQSMSVTVN